MSLDLSSESLRTLLYEASDIAVELYAGLEDRSVMHDKSRDPRNDPFLS